MEHASSVGIVRKEIRENWIVRISFTFLKKEKGVLEHARIFIEM